MNIHNARIVVSAVSPKQYPKDEIPELAFAGRSNVGKSSFINKILNRKNLAHTSGKPGKTAQINFYNIDETIHLVDLPGYGYAEVSKKEKEKWGHMIDEYLNTREQLVSTILLVDARHKPSKDDVTMAHWIRHNHGQLIAFATKADKVSKKELESNLSLIFETLMMSEEDVLIPFSAQTGLNTDVAWDVINQLCGLEEA